MTAEPLGNTTSIVSRRRRYELREAAAKLLPGERVGWCGSKVIQPGGMVDIQHSKSGAYYHGLATCGSVWTCPVCASRIAAERREELGDAITGWDGSLLMLTMTLQHSRDDDLAELLAALKDVWRRMKSGRWWKSIKDEFELAAYVTATEVTYGAANGWHPHLHVLIFSRLPEHKFDRARFKNLLFEQYDALLAKKAHFASEYYGLNVRLGDDKAGDYVSKYGLEWELANSTTKNGRGGMSPFELLAAYAGGGAGWAGVLFKEYAQVFSGHNQLTWSRGARQVLKLGDELTDEAIAAGDEPEAETLLTLTYEQFKRILKAGAVVSVLEIADGGDAWSVWQYLQDELNIIPEVWQVEPFLEYA